MGVGTPWVAAFLDSFSKGKPAAQVMLGSKLSSSEKSWLSGGELGQQLCEYEEVEGSWQRALWVVSAE